MARRGAQESSVGTRCKTVVRSAPNYPFSNVIFFTGTARNGDRWFLFLFFCALMTEEKKKSARNCAPNSHITFFFWDL